MSQTFLSFLIMINLFSSSVTEDCKIKVCGLLDGSGVFQVPDDSCADINITTAKSYTVKIENLCEATAASISICKPPVVTITKANCTTTVDTYNFQTVFSTDVGTTVVSATRNSSVSGSSVVTFPNVVSATYSEVISYNVVHTDSCGNTWTTTFSLTMPNSLTVPACNLIVQSTPVTTLTTEYADYTYDADGCLVLDASFFDSTATGSFSDGVYAITVTLNYLDGTTSKSYFEIEGVLLACTLKCEVYAEASELIALGDYEKSAFLTLAYNVLENVVFCNLNRACEVLNYVKSFIDQNECNC